MPTQPILDLHAHRANPQAILSCTPAQFTAAEGQLCSVGLHPWDAQTDDEAALALLAEQLQRPDVVAVGECGIDTLRGGLLFRQMLLFRRQIELSEAAGKPMVLHAVKANEVVIGIHADLKPRQRWVVHGFRGKPTVAEMFLRAGIGLSFGEQYNPDTLRMVPADMLYAETDMSALSIDEILERQQAHRPDLDLRATVARNIASLIQSPTR